MRPSTHQVSRTERVASFAAATAVTVGTALLSLAALRPIIVSAPVGPTARTARPPSEDLAFIATAVSDPLPVPISIPPRQAARSSARPEPRSVGTSTMSRDGPARRIAGTDSTPVAPIATGAPVTAAPKVAASRSGATAGAPASAAVVAITHANADPVRIDSLIRELSERIPLGIVIRPPVPPPLTQAEKDAKWRDEAFEAVAARGAGQPIRRTMAGGSIPVPLPFGGPSRQQRERDRAIYAELRVTVARRQQRVDSIVAARARRRADSLARVADSLRPRSR